MAADFKHSRSSGHKQPAVPEEEKPPTFSGYLQARRELLAIEAREAAGHAKAKGIQAGVFVFALCIFWVLLLCAGISFLGKWVAALWGERFPGIGWEAVAIAIGILHLFIGLIALLKIRRKPAEGLFHHTLSEFQKDRQWLQRKKDKKES